MPINSAPKTSEKSCTPVGSSSAAKNVNVRVTTDDALNYLWIVKHAFYDEPDKYESFLNVMKEFRKHSIDTATVASRMQNLLSGHPELIPGFNFFLPREHQIPFSDEEEDSQLSDEEDEDEDEDDEDGNEEDEDFDSVSGSDDI